MNIFVLHPDGKNIKDHSEEHPIVHTEPAHDTNEGSEFLDDAIYMHEQPLTQTEGSISVAFPEDSL